MSMNTPAVQQAYEEFDRLHGRNPEPRFEDIRSVADRFGTSIAAMLDFAKQHVALMKADLAALIKEAGLDDADGNENPENDVEGAALAIAALMATHPEEDEAFYNITNQIFDEYCPILKLAEDSESREAQLEADELMDIVFDGAERIRAEFPATI